MLQELRNGLSIPLNKGGGSMSQTITLPSGLGKSYTYMEWRTITSPSSNQYKLREQATANGEVSYSDDGKIYVNGRTLVAMTTTFGNVGDYVDIQTADGTVIHGIIGDIKNQNDSGANQWGHNGGQSVVEFITNKKLSNNYPGNGGVVSVTNLGNYFNGDNPGTITATPTGVVQDKFTNIFQKIFVFLVCVFIGVVGVFFFMKAFGISLDPKKMVANTIEQKTGIDVEGVLE